MINTPENILGRYFTMSDRVKLKKKIQGNTVYNASANIKFMIKLGKLIPDLNAENQHYNVKIRVKRWIVQMKKKRIKRMTRVVVMAIF